MNSNQFPRILDTIITTKKAWGIIRAKRLMRIRTRGQEVFVIIIYLTDAWDVL